MVYTLKYIIIGDSGCGKSSIMSKYTNDYFNDETNSTVGVEFTTKEFVIQNHQFKIHFWDLAGQERFRAIVRSYYRNVDAVILTFDLSNPATYNNLEYWYQEVEKIMENANSEICNPVVYLVGNKYDKVRNVQYYNIDKFMKNKKIKKYIVCSAKTSYNIDYLFDIINNNVYQNQLKLNRFQSDQNEQETIILNQNNKFSSKLCCY